MNEKKLSFDYSKDVEWRLNDYRSEDYVMTSADVERVKNSRWKLIDQIRLAIEQTESDETRCALKLASDIVLDEIQALVFLSGTKKQLADPHVATWIALTNKIERLSEELERVTRRFPEDPCGEDVL